MLNEAGNPLLQTEPTPRSWLNIWVTCLVIVLLFAGVLAFVAWRLFDPRARTVTESGPDGGESFGNAGNRGFSPDGTTFAYLWRDATYYYPPQLGARPLTMTDSLQVRLFSVHSPDCESSVPLCSIDLRPSGIVYYAIRGKVCFSPDSKCLAALSAGRILIIDPESKRIREVTYTGESFCDMTWLTKDEIVFITLDRERYALWRYDLREPPGTRRLVREQKQEWLRHSGVHYPENSVRKYDWAPDGCSVVLKNLAQTDDETALMDTASGKTLPLMGYVQEICWKQDGSQLLLCGQVEPNKFPGTKRVLLVKVRDWNVTDLTKEFEAAFGKDMDVSFASPCWTREGYVILSNTRWLRSTSPDGVPRKKCTGYVIQVQPFKIIMSNTRFIRQSPIRGWALLQGENDFDWISYDGKRTIPLKGWPNQWTWSADGTHAADVRGGKMVLFEVKSPPSTGSD